MNKVGSRKFKPESSKQEVRTPQAVEMELSLGLFVELFDSLPRSEERLAVLLRGGGPLRGLAGSCFLPSESFDPRFRRRWGSMALIKWEVVHVGYCRLPIFSLVFGSSLRVGRSNNNNDDGDSEITQY